MMIKNDEEVYRLWWEYLRRSKNYKEFCDWMIAKRKDRSRPAPDKFNPKKNGELKHILFTFLCFRDIYSVSFKEWWKWFKKNAESNEFRVLSGIKAEVLSEQMRSSMVTASARSNRAAKVKVTTEAVTNAEYYFDRCIESYKELHGKEPKLREFKKFFPVWSSVSTWGVDKLFLVVDVSVSEPKDLAEDVRKLISQKRKTPETKSAVSRNYSWRPSSYLHIEELKRYLDVYDLREKEPPTTWPDIVQQFASKANIIEDIRTFKLYNQKAKKIIENVEHGHFP